MLVSVQASRPTTNVLAPRPGPPAIMVPFPLTICVLLLVAAIPKAMPLEPIIVPSLRIIV